MKRADTLAASAGLMLIATVCLFSVVGAVAFQHVFDKQPCPWCILQRVIYLAMAAVALLGSGWIRHGGRIGRVIASACALLVAGLGLAGIATAGYQNLVASKLPSCDLTLADRIISGLGLDAWQPEVFEVRASCMDAVVHLLGVPFELWSLALYALVTAFAVWIAGRCLRT